MRKQSSWRRALVICVLCAMAAMAAPAQTFTTLVSFDYTDGGYPRYDSPIQGLDGNLYGTTYQGGAKGSGTVFQITSAGTLTTLYSFCIKAHCADGDFLAAGLVQATDGNFYGTTEYGGANDLGTVFKITPVGTLTTLHSFDAADGAPIGRMVQGTNGNFYGTTGSGGIYNGGTVFEITPAGTLTTVYNFCAQTNCSDGSHPQGVLVQATNGNFYGTTSRGGANNSCQLGCGTVFKITPAGKLATIYSFCAKANCADGDYPQAGLVQASNGNFYGTTSLAPGQGPAGTVFAITPLGELRTLYTFCAQADCSDGDGPNGALVQATDGNFYGTTLYGGANGYGTIFEVTPAGALTTLYSFCAQTNCTDGNNPLTGLVQATDGNFYGTTFLGGANNAGTVFSLAVGLGPFVETQPTLGKVGATVRILGTNLTGATSVSFNGTVAAFTVVSSSLIKTTVPAGAATGKVQVVTPSGTLTTNVLFRVRP